MSDIERHALMTCDLEHEDAVGPLYYFKLYDRMPGPYKTQLHRKAIIDVASDGTLAGVELIDDMPPPPRPTDPPKSLVEHFGAQCPDYDPDCAGCFAHKQEAEILRLRAEVEKLRAVLKPFVDAGHFKVVTNVGTTEEYNQVSISVREHHLRAAAAALKETGDE